MSYNRDDGNTQMRFEFFRQDGKSTAGGDIHHVQSDHQGCAQFDKLGDEIKVALKVGGIDNNYHGIGLGSVSAQAAQNFHGNHFIR